MATQLSRYIYVCTMYKMLKTILVSMDFSKFQLSMTIWFIAMVFYCWRSFSFIDIYCRSIESPWKYIRPKI